MSTHNRPPKAPTLYPFPSQRRRCGIFVVPPPNESFQLRRSGIGPIPQCRVVRPPFPPSSFPLRGGASQFASGAATASLVNAPHSSALQLFATLRVGPSSLQTHRKGDPRKVRLACRLRQETTMTLKWIAVRLRMGGMDPRGQPSPSFKEINLCQYFGLIPLGFRPTRFVYVGDL